MRGRPQAREWVKKSPKAKKLGEGEASAWRVGKKNPQTRELGEGGGGSGWRVGEKYVSYWKGVRGRCPGLESWLSGRPQAGDWD